MDVITDSAGRFRLSGLPSGEHVVLMRALGFENDSAVVDIDGNEVSMRDFVLRRQVVSLPEQRVTASEIKRAGKMAGFLEREKFGVGHFVNRDALAKEEGRMQTGDILARVPGLSVRRGQSKAWIASSRATNAAGGCAFCRPAVSDLDPADKAAGARPACYMDVYLDGILIYDDTRRPRLPLFNVNSIELSEIEGIEVYTSAAQIPAQYNRTSSGCGVLVIWTRI
jgi:hypothetical protein